MKVQIELFGASREFSNQDYLEFDIGNDSIINLSCSINITAPPGTYDFNFENVTIVDSTNQNISVPAAETGQITIEETFLTMVINTKVFLQTVFVRKFNIGGGLLSKDEE